MTLRVVKNSYEKQSRGKTYDATADCKDSWFIATALLDWSTGFGVVDVVEVLVAFPPAAAFGLSNGSGVRVGIAGMVVGGPRMIAWKQTLRFTKLQKLGSFVNTKNIFLLLEQPRF